VWIRFGAPIINRDLPSTVCLIFDQASLGILGRVLAKAAADCESMLDGESGTGSISPINWANFAGEHNQ
jgi:hypothetical protein